MISWGGNISIQIVVVARLDAVRCTLTVSLPVFTALAWLALERAPQHRVTMCVSLCHVGWPLLVRDDVFLRAVARVLDVLRPGCLPAGCCSCLVGTIFLTGPFGRRAGVRVVLVVSRSGARSAGLPHLEPHGTVPAVSHPEVPFEVCPVVGRVVALSALEIKPRFVGFVDVPCPCPSQGMIHLPGRPGVLRFRGC